MENQPRSRFVANFVILMILKLGVASNALKPLNKWGQHASFSSEASKLIKNNILDVELYYL